MEKEHELKKKEGTLEPKPPEILQKLLWLWLYGREHWKLVLLALLILFVSSYFVLPHFDIISLIKSIHF